jgi:hypothetical protein
MHHEEFRVDTRLGLGCSRGSALGRSDSGNGAGYHRRYRRRRGGDTTRTAAGGVGRIGARPVTGKWDSYKPSHPMQQSVTSAAVNVLVSTLWPESIVENEEFRTLVAVLDATRIRIPQDSTR